MHSSSSVVSSDQGEIRSGKPSLLDTFAQDFRYGARLLLKKPGFAVIAVSQSLSAWAANAAIFSLFMLCF